MSHSENLAAIKGYLEDSYEREDTRKVPKRSDLTFGNRIKRIPHAVVLYVDMRGSRKIMKQTTAFVSIKVHRAFLQAVIYCVENREGHFRSFNGDGALAFFIGENAASRAVASAMDLKAYIREMNRSLTKTSSTRLDFGVGISQGVVFVAKSGKRGDDSTKQDLVWIGTPVYGAVELSDLARKPENIWIGPQVRKSIGREKRFGVVYSNGKSMWTASERELRSLGQVKARHTSFFSRLF
jgi:class 3 adenylate cyclase